MWVRSLGQEDLLEMEMEPHSSILAWEIPWTEKPGGLPSMGSQRLGHRPSDSTTTTRETGGTDASLRFSTCGQWGAGGKPGSSSVSPTRLLSHGWSMLRGPSHSSFQ